jgi:hypothetical protein
MISVVQTDRQTDVLSMEQVKEDDDDSSGESGGLGVNRG